MNLIEHKNEALTRLRVTTRAAHERVDEAFSHYNLESKISYISFLKAHAKVLPLVENWLKSFQNLPEWEGRSELLRHDLASLQSDFPPTLGWARRTEEGAALGGLYVIDGSRLGAKFLSSRLGAGFPSSYLSAPQKKGSWSRLLSEIQTQMVDKGEAFQDDVIAGARAVFELFYESALSEME
ncbi:biliverdin-producing heme oxygenase [Swingsia samuiensis]|uniref:Heme oxygenase n=1 Tax=Swingsia samuiensis TaxID=1293412 RepID=A0A4Y6UFM6_9PROT|nr:biliverdin-producing heme oxygenase [Swingsia samuiensis]QDH16362.1 hypothetical protein E3D00_01365 [Swingsia samuiensis]